MVRKALIDGDILLYRVGFASENVKERYATSRLHRSIDSILQQTGCKDYEVFISDSLENNFRHDIFPLYKANRTLPKPVHFNSLSDTIVQDHSATICYGMEADDGLGINATRLGEEAVIVSIDKDLLQIPGEHYNWVTGTWRTITEEEGLFRFYRQILTGDPTDNVTGAVGLGCPGIGERRANNVLEGCSTESSYRDTIWNVFSERLKDYDRAELITRIEVTGQLVKILTKHDERWTYDYDGSKS